MVYLTKVNVRGKVEVIRFHPEGLMKIIHIFFSFFCIFSVCTLPAEEAKKEDASKKKPLEEKTVETQHSLKIQGTNIDYKSIAGTIVLKNEEDQKASFFYTAYLKEGVDDLSSRPVTFCFNGGPGSSSVWLHLGAFGPQKVVIKENGDVEPPYRLEDNTHSILDVTDLVFIDPVSTGYSKPANGEDAKQFHGVDEDIKSVAEFIRLFVTKYERWESPKFIAGESYGTTRAAGLASELHDEYFMYVNGILLVSSVLDFQTMRDFGRGNDLPYILFLPTYTATAHYHQLLTPELQKKSLKDAVKESEEFALTQYAAALLQGDRLEDSKRQETEKKLSEYTGLSQEYIHDADLRVNSFQFRKQLLRDKKRIVGRFDSRYTGVDIKPLAETAMMDPSAEAVFGLFTATFNHYIRTVLGWKQDEKYEILANVFPWDWKATNEYLNVANGLRDVMSKNTQLKVFVGNGYYDMATPFFATEYTFNHLNLDPSIRGNVVMEYYDAGHMMYIHEPSLIKLNNDIRSFINNAL
jgi:carboxypeptidase C (cathepsin A)